MKSFPAGSQLALVRTRDCDSNFDVMVSAGKEDKEKLQDLEDAINKQRYMRAVNEYKLIPDPLESGRLALALPRGWAAPPTVAHIVGWEKIETLDGRSWISLCRSLGLKEIVVVMTPITDTVTATVEACRGNRPDNLIHRSQMRKADMRKAIGHLFYGLGENAVRMKTKAEIDRVLGPVFSSQRSMFRQVLAEVWTSDYNKRVDSAASLVITTQGMATAVSYSAAAEQFDVRENAVAAKVKDTKRPRKQGAAFSKTTGRTIAKKMKEANDNIDRMEDRLQRDYDRGLLESYSDCINGMSLLEKSATHIAERIAEIKKRFKEANAMKTAGAGA